MADTAEQAVEEIAEVVGGEIEVFPNEQTGEWHVAIKTDDESYSGYGHSREQAFSNLVRECKAVGWVPPTPLA
jgi:hypothetical protein